ncbi:glycosyltransferase family 39 protein [Aphanothece microscopica]|uniref:glycosyltransferase family 39 protein n=1 Tax=Aphanothece microscopica TaxID=1049561 RepID=UPI003CE4F9D5
MRSAGFPSAERELLISPSADLRAEDLQRYLNLSEAHGWRDTLRELVRHPEHPPLYFLLARLVREGLGASMEHVRQLSALFSLFALPAMFWLAMEVSGSIGLATTAAGTMAVSPLQLLYAQEARPYSLLVLLTALASAAYLRLRRAPDRLTWGLYGLLLLAGLYTSLLFLLIPLSHGLHALLRRNPTGHRRRWASATGLALLGFLPWAGIMVSRREALIQHTAWLREPPPSLPFGTLRSLHWSSPFLDLGHPLPQGWALGALPLVVGLSLSGAVLLARRSPSGGWSALLLLLLANVLVLELGDRLTGGQHALVTRYLLPGLLGFQILVAANFWALLRSSHGRVLGVGLLVACLLGGALSCRAILTAETWWSRYAIHQPAVLAYFLDAYPGSAMEIVNSPTSFGEAISLAQRLAPHTRLQFTESYSHPGSGAIVYRNQLGQVVLAAPTS